MRPEHVVIPERLVAAVVGWVDLACIAALTKLYHFRHEAHIVFRGWTALFIRSILMLLWINLTVLGDIGLIPDETLCRLCTAALSFFYSYISSVAVQCWHTYVCWSSLSMIINAGNTRVTILRPPSFLRYRPLLTAPLFEICFGVILMIASGAPSLKTIIGAGFAVVNPDGVSMAERCSGDTSVVTATMFGIAALTLALLAKSLYSANDRFGLSREIGGISVSLGAAAVLRCLESAVAPGAFRIIEFFEMLMMISINLIWSLCLPLYISRDKYTSNKLSKSFKKTSQRPKASVSTEPGQSMLSTSSTLADVLRDKNGGRVLFKRFCISEFSVENILWLECSDNFKSKYAQFSNQAGSESTASNSVDLGEFIDDLDDIVKGFVRADGVLTLNLPSSISSAVLDYASRIDRSGADADPAMVPETVRRGLHLVQKVDYSVMDLMKDTFSRFRCSPLYINFVHEFSTAVDLNPSQTLPTGATRL